MRRIKLPGGINHENINSSLSNGILKIVLPKSEIKEKKQISIS
jgi:HSP20 family molecular chaperone IbpA